MFQPYTCASLLLALLSSVLPRVPAAAAAPGDDAIRSPPPSFPNGPFRAAGDHTRLYGADGRRVTYAGVNWPGAEVTMVPEGLQYQSVREIASRVQSLGMNAVRLTYATEMIDQMYHHGDDDDEGDGAPTRDVPISASFVRALGRENGTALFERVLEKNPTFPRDITHIQVYDAIINELSRKSIYVHLDNHISKAGWCCTPFDGNAWWGDVHFSPSNWTRGLSYMAEKARTSWPNVMSMSLYNELRPPLSAGAPGLIRSYNWAVWYEQARRGARAIHDRHPDVLVFLSGVGGDTDLGPVVDGTPLGPGPGGAGAVAFTKAGFAPGFEDKLVLELHSYDILSPVADCESYGGDLLESGFSAAVPPSDDDGDDDDDDDDGNNNKNNNNTTTTTTTVVKNRFPVMMTEWGFVQDETTWRDGTYARCAQAFLGDQVPGAGWFLWVLGGSYYAREGRQDADETWGLLNHDWSGWRSPAFVKRGLVPLVKKTLRRGGRMTN